MTNLELFLGDCIEEMKKIESNSIHSVVTDPPYNLDLDKSKWDNFGSNARFSMWCREWARECLRVLRPGGYLISFSASRTYHRMVCGIEDAGFDIKDCINWLYFSGVPKSQHYGKIDKRLMGWSTALKPCFEPAVLAQKPLREKSVAKQLLKSRTGGLNIEATRFRYGDDCWVGPQHDHSGQWDKPGFTNFTKGNCLINSNKQNRKKVDLSSYKPTGGRWPGNIFHCKKPSRKEKDIGMSNVDGLTKNPHPTVKPLKLIKWCIRLTTAKGGTVLDPFMGSGTTAIAAITQGYKVIGVEQNPMYFGLIEKRLEWVENRIKKT